jgi:plasmid stabilization system protein ParE
VKVLVLSSAENDLRAGFEFYERRQVGIGTYFLECISRDIDALEVEVGIHRTEDGYHRRLSDRFPFAIYYTVETDAVRVWRVLDLRRDPVWLRQELRK